LAFIQNSLMKSNYYTVVEIITGIFYRPSLSFERLKQARGNALLFFFTGILPFIVFGAAARALTASMAWDENMNLWLPLFFIHLASFSLTFFLGTFLISKLASVFKSSDDLVLIFLLITFSYLPFLTAVAVAILFPDSQLIRFVGLAYTILTFGKGAAILLGTPATKKIGFTLISFFLLFGGNYVINILFEFLFLPHSNI
jgi:hypothetical protein